MHRLTRQVRFAINDSASDAADGPPTNSYGGYPTLVGFGRYLSLDITLTGDPSPLSNYVINIKDIDEAVRRRAIPVVASAVRSVGNSTPATLIREIFKLLSNWPPLTLEQVRLNLSPFLSFTATTAEQSMIQLSQKFEFSATHRLHNPQASDEQNRKTFGKCNNPHGHGHNYELQVTLAGAPDANGVLIDIPAFERIVAQTVIDKFDHKNLNLELPEFRERIPTVENIALVIYRLLKPKFDATKLKSVTVWETPKTWCEYSEE
jgi:6-pyruvoyltetrahydropterin/6-carboxytetrahydropterin synthase